MAFFIPADPTQPTRDVEPKNGTNFTFIELYRLLDCTCIELRHLPSGRLMVMDEESKLVRQPVRNDRATWLAAFATPKEFVAQLLRWRASGVQVITAGLCIDDTTDEIDYVAGDALICEDHEIR